MKIAIGADHAGFVLKAQIIEHLRANTTHTWHDFGTYSEASMDYPDVAHPTAEAVAEQGFDSGILICGSANGVAITANKHANIRAALCWNEEVATLAREHNNANIICIPARFVSTQVALSMVDIFIKTSFLGGRHAERISKINC